MKILVTGVAGYIGGTFAYEALKKGHEVIGVDNFASSSDININKIKDKYSKNFSFCKNDLMSSNALINALNNVHDLDAIMHFAALKNIPESEEKPSLYKKNNIESTETILNYALYSNIEKIIFSSSAAIYGLQKKYPIKENAKPNPLSVYAETKLTCEKLIREFSIQNNLKSISLRYFNPVAAHSDFLVYEDYAKSNNLISSIIKTALNNDKSLEIYGNDYSTKDGTAERDFIHISDLINGHFFALDKIDDIKNTEEINLGTGISVSVLELISAFKRVNNLEFDVNFAGRRKGDIAINFADVSKAKEVLGWQSRYNLEDMCKDAWKVIRK